MNFEATGKILNIWIYLDLSRFWLKASSKRHEESYRNITPNSKEHF
jgi:hypothetical protein